MLLQVPLSDAIKIVGKRGRTRTRDIVPVLRQHAYSCPDRLVRGMFQGNCLIKVVFTKSHSHWVLFWEGKIYDPSRGLNPPGFFALADRGHYKLSSYLPIEG